MHALKCIARNFPVPFNGWKQLQACTLARPLGQVHFSTKYLKTGCVYVHWPFCKKKCTYCDFNKYVSSDVNHERMRHCLVHEIDHQVKESFIEDISSVFFGGGTPSLALPSTIEVGIIKPNLPI